MKVPLRYQVTNNDCGPTSMLNALSYLCEREEIPPEVLKYTYALMIDRHRGSKSPGGTSERAMAFCAHWLNDCAASVGFPVEALHLRGDDVAFTDDSLLVQWVEKGGVAVTSCFLCNSDHYVLITGIERDEQDALAGARLFDPWYLDPEGSFAEGGQFAHMGSDVTFVHDEPFSCNRIVSARLIEGCVKCDYSLTCNTPREATLLRRTTTDNLEDAYDDANAL